MRALAGAGFADEADHLAGRDVEADALDDLLAALVAEAHVVRTRSRPWRAARSTAPGASAISGGVSRTEKIRSAPENAWVIQLRTAVNHWSGP